MDHSNNYYGEEAYFGNGNSSSSSRKGKKSNSNSDHNNKARKQPQRGLGVAQLEKIRLHSHQLQTPYHPPPPNYYNYHPSHFNYNEDPRVQMSYSPNSYAFQPHTTMSNCIAPQSNSILCLVSRWECQNHGKLQSVALGKSRWITVILTYPP
ncbi:hypothetical protein L195_g024190 [Trifolium pratense]|uniref:Uncharacterized protein n=1 Tax=Trifolium pratense TaxID=57577 RepID=A0A2K3ND01_TRIPR|nr:hypothetical protein L195_g024190 [Trifolium pratense]